MDISDLALKELPSSQIYTLFMDVYCTFVNVNMYTYCRVHKEICVFAAISVLFTSTTISMPTLDEGLSLTLGNEVIQRLGLACKL